MKKNQWMVIGALVLAFGGGLIWSRYTGQRPGGVAIVDLEEVARALGRDKEIVSSLQTQRGALSQQLLNAQNQVNSELTQLQKSMGEQPSPDAVRDLQLKAANYQKQLANMQNQAAAVLNEHGKKVLQEFRDSAKPVAIEVAREKGLTTVMTKDDGVIFAFDEAVDITADVIARLRESQPAATPATNAQESAPAPQTATPAVAQQPQAPERTIIQTSATDAGTTN